MSWIERVQRKILFLLGDGAVFQPEYFDAQKVQDFNVSVFDFVGIEGTLVRRKKPKGRKFKIKIIFQGENNIEEANRFEESAKDPRHWHIKHPIYDDIRVQPLSLKYDNSVLNITTITGTVIETILGDFPGSLIVPQGLVGTRTALADDTAVFQFADDTVVIEGEDVDNFNTTIDILSSNTLKVVEGNTELSEYVNLTKEAKRDVATVTSDPLTATQSLRSLINAPTTLGLGVFTTQRLLTAQFDQFKTLMIGVNSADLSVTGREFYESVQSIVLSTMFFNSAFPLPGDYETRNQVFDLIAQLIGLYDSFLDDLDNLQLSDFSQLEVYIPNSETLTALDNAFSTTVSNLFNVALDAKQEKIIVLLKDSNAIELTHRIYGLDAEDLNLDTFVTTNELTINEHLNIKKGREIKYYI